MPAPTPKGLVFTGARARLSVSGQVVGYATDCSGGEEIQYEAVRTLDNIRVSEWVPVGYEVSFSASRVRLIGQPLQGPDLNIFPKVGQNSSDHLLNILNMGDLTIQVEDTVTGQIFCVMEQCKVSGHNWSLGARSIVGENISFVGIVARGEAES